MFKVKGAIRQHNEGVTLNIFAITGAKYTVFPAGYNQWRKRIEIKP